MVKTTKGTDPKGAPNSSTIAMASKDKSHYYLYRTRKIAGKNVVVADHGKWIALDDKELALLESKNVEEGSKLYDSLIENGIIIKEENMKSIQERYNKKMCFMFQGVSLHIIVVTNRCNHQCVYCHAASSKSSKKELDMSEETAKKTVDLIFQSTSGAITIEFQGGEPLLNYDVVKYIVKYAKEKNKTAKKDVQFTCVTNMLGMDDEKMKFLTDEGVTICTSLDGPEEVHRKNRKPEDPCINSFENTSKMIKKFQAYYKKLGKEYRVNALTTITRAALENPKGVVDVYVDHNQKDIHLRPLDALGKAHSTWNTISYSAEDFLVFWKKAVDYIIEVNKKGTFLRERTILIMLQKMFEDVDPNYLDLRCPCGACIGQLAYNYNGEVYSCDEGRMLDEDIFKLGTVDQSYKAITGSDASLAIINASINDNCECSKCVWKPYCGTCPVYTFKQTYSLVPVTFESDRCRVLFGQFEYVVEKLMKDKEFEKIAHSWLNYDKVPHSQE